MKKCPKCNIAYDDTWGICIHCSTPLVDKGFHLDILPLSSIGPTMAFENYSNRLLLPKTGFYDNWNNTQERMLQMMKDIFVYLKIKKNSGDTILNYDEISIVSPEFWNSGILNSNI